MVAIYTFYFSINNKEERGVLIELRFLYFKVYFYFYFSFENLLNSLTLVYIIGGNLACFKTFS